jgi:hypothetical protein
MSTETAASKKSFLTRVMENVRAKENGEGTEETVPTQKMLIKKIAIAGGAVVAGTAAVTLALKFIAERMEYVAPEE